MKQTLATIINSDLFEIIHSLRTAAGQSMHQWLAQDPRVVSHCQSHNITLRPLSTGGRPPKVRTHTTPTPMVQHVDIPIVSEPEEDTQFQPWKKDPIRPSLSSPGVVTEPDPSETSEPAPNDAPRNVTTPEPKSPLVDDSSGRKPWDMHYIETRA